MKELYRQQLTDIKTECNMKEQKGTRINVWFISDTHFSHPSILYFHPERREAAGITLEELQADKHAAVEKHDEWLIDL